MKNQEKSIKGKLIELLLKNIIFEKSDISVIQEFLDKYFNFSTTISNYMETTQDGIFFDIYFNILYTQRNSLYYN